MSESARLSAPNGLEISAQELAQLDLEEAFRNRWANMASVLRWLAGCYERAGLERQTALGLANVTILSLCEYADGERIYFGKPDVIARCVRDRRMRLAFQNRNYASIAAQYGVSSVTVWRALFRQKVLVQKIKRTDVAHV